VASRELVVCSSKLPNFDGDDPCVIEDRRTSLFCVSLRSCGGATRLWRDGDDASSRHVRCDEYSIESSSEEIEARERWKQCRVRSCSTAGVHCRIATGSSPRSQSEKKIQS
jgi:hypothetical protein